MKNNSTNMSFRVDKDLKKQADELFKDLGMNTSVALNMFLTQCVREQEIPFVPSRNYRTPNKELLEALNEGENILNGKITAKRYNDVHQMIEDIINEDEYTDKN